MTAPAPLSGRISPALYDALADLNDRLIDDGKEDVAAELTYLLSGADEAPLSGGDARTQPTDDERETAIDALGYRGRTYGEIPGSFVYHVDAVAQALADQRARYERIAGQRTVEALELAAVLTVPSEDTAADVRDALLRRADALRAEESA